MTPTKWAELPELIRVSALIWHRAKDRNDIAWSVYNDLIEFLAGEEGERQAVAALDAILAPLLAPYELEMRSAQAAEQSNRQAVAEAIVRWGEAVKRFHFPLRCGFCGAGVTFSEKCGCRDAQRYKKLAAKPVEWLIQSEWTQREKDIGPRVIFDPCPPEYMAFRDGRDGRRIRVVPDETRWGIWLVNEKHWAYPLTGDTWPTREAAELHLAASTLHEYRGGTERFEVRPYPMGTNQ